MRGSQNDALTHFKLNLFKEIKFWAISVKRKAISKSIVVSIHLAWTFHFKALFEQRSAYGIRYARFWILNSGFLDSAQKWSLALITLATFLPQAQNLAPRGLNLSHFFRPLGQKLTPTILNPSHCFTLKAGVNLKHRAFFKKFSHVGFNFKP